MKARNGDQFERLLDGKWVFTATVKNVSQSQSATYLAKGYPEKYRLRRNGALVKFNT